MSQATFPSDFRAQKQETPKVRDHEHEVLISRRDNNRKADFAKRLFRKAIPAFFALGLALLFAGSAQTGGRRHSAPAFINKTPGSLMAPALGIAMADFTGDTHPDLATVELDRFDSPSAHYSIEIRLSEGGRQSLRLTAPFGGLLITPKDVTGDGNLDLIVRSARSHVPVAVFLNDGRGHFSPAAPAAFAQALRETPCELDFTADQTYFGATLISPESYTIACRNVSVRNPELQDGTLLPANFDAPSHLFLPFGSNRAPPAVA